jgi:hypothetical protein
MPGLLSRTPPLASAVPAVAITALATPASREYNLTMELQLAYKYKSKSNLMRREFVVTVECFDFTNGDTALNFEVIAPDPNQARTIVYRAMLNALATPVAPDGFRISLVREVIYVWHGDCHYKVPTVKVSEV